MAQFMIAYHGGNQPKTREEGQAQMEKWKSWVASLGDKLVNPGTPLSVSKLVTSKGVVDDQNPGAMKGFAVVTVENMDEAVKIAQTDPFLENGGTIRVSQMMEM